MWRPLVVPTALNGFNVTSDPPNPLTVGLSVLWALRNPAPAPAGTGTIDHSPLQPVLDQLRTEGLAGLSTNPDPLASYLRMLEEVDPDELSREDSLAYWLNLYNAGVLRLAAAAYDQNLATVLRIPGGFSKSFAEVAGRSLSLDAVEHAKIRRFQDPRVHGSLVCGSASCPTLRYEPFDGPNIEVQLENQMRAFLAGGGAVLTDNTLLLSRIFRWFGGDVVRPHRMPTFLPARPEKVAVGLAGWMEPDLAEAVMGGELRVDFQPYDWSLGCSIA